MNYCLECGYVSLTKKKEELCGDKVEIIQNDSSITLVLADGLGSGVKANILATLTSKILSIMASNDIALDECVKTIISTLPVCKVRRVAYSTFSLIHLYDNGDGYLVEFDNPQAIILRDCEYFELPREEIIIEGKKIYVTKLHLQTDDMVFVMSDGVIHAGIGTYLNLGWNREKVVSYLLRNINPNLSAKGAASIITSECYDLYEGEPGDDTSVACLKVRTSYPVSIMVGPPARKEADSEIVRKFLQTPGRKVCCGGTTSNIVARYLNEDVEPVMEYVDPQIPPIGKIKGIDLVTEGVITLRRVLELSEDYLKNSNPSIYTFDKKDGASRLAKMLFERATDIHFFIGRSFNPAHENLPIDYAVKMKLIENISRNLKLMGKKVELEYN